MVKGLQNYDLTALRAQQVGLAQRWVMRDVKWYFPRTFPYLAELNFSN